MNSDEYVESVYEEMRAELEPQLSDFEFDVAYPYEVGEPATAVHDGIMVAIAERVLVSDHLLERVRPVLDVPTFVDSYEYAKRAFAEIAAERSH